MIRIGDWSITLKTVKTIDIVLKGRIVPHPRKYPLDHAFRQSLYIFNRSGMILKTKCLFQALKEKCFQVKALRLPQYFYYCLFFMGLIGSPAWGDLAMAFNPPGPEGRLKAIGPMAGLPETLRLALDPGTDFELIPPPKPGDWLAAHPEPGQSFEEFVRSRPNRPDQTRSQIYLYPLGHFSPEGSPPVEFLNA